MWLEVSSRCPPPPFGKDIHHHLFHMYITVSIFLWRLTTKQMTWFTNVHLFLNSAWSLTLPLSPCPKERSALSTDDLSLQLLYEKDAVQYCDGNGCFCHLSLSGRLPGIRFPLPELAGPGWIRGLFLSWPDVLFLDNLHMTLIKIAPCGETNGNYLSYCLLLNPLFTQVIQIYMSK